MRTAGFGRRLAALSLLGSVASLNLEQLAAVKLRRVVVGDGDALARLADEPAVAAGALWRTNLTLTLTLTLALTSTLTKRVVAAGSLWRTSGAVLYASRRPA